ncbi:MAG: GH3 auxin-responsive promoter family protein [Syntrophomonadaceae bacterium]
MSMSLDDRMANKQFDEIWREYCGFLDLSMSEYMDIQNRLMMEQIELFSECELGKRIMKGKKPKSIDEFRRVVPLTTYEDYADLLLPKVESALPAKPLLWIETTWEGSVNPIKVAPYTASMINSYKNNLLAIMILATSEKKGHFSLRDGDKFLYGMAPLPYITGLVPHVISSELSIDFLPPTQQAEAMSFSERNKAGYRLGVQKGVDLFFGLSSVIVKMGESFASSSGSSGKSKFYRNSPKMNYRLLRAWIRSKREHTPILPKDIWSLKGLICAGTDSSSLKKKIEEIWGVKPLEMFGGTEPACIATETWSKDGLVMFPDVGFYEFIPKVEWEKNIDDPAYLPNTYLMNELVPGNEYELVISNLKGGAFVRYRVGDIFRCISLENEEEGLKLPQFRYVDRIPGIIDIAGFTRISEATISEALLVSKLDISDWFAVKEFDEMKRAFLHLYVEVGSGQRQGGLTKEIINEHLAIYFRYVDSDYKDLKALLGIEPLQVTIIPRGTIREFGSIFNRRLRKMNPPKYDVTEVLKIAHGVGRKEVS